VTETSTQLERRAERARERLADRLGELRDNVSPSRVVSDIFDIKPGKWGVDDAARLLMEQVKTNPIACTLIAAGIGLLIYPNNNAKHAAQSATGTRRTPRKRRVHHRKRSSNSSK
jgi:hypothetical protein